MFVVNLDKFSSGSVAVLWPIEGIKWEIFEKIVLQLNVW